MLGKEREGGDGGAEPALSCPPSPPPEGLLREICSLWLFCGIWLHRKRTFGPGITTRPPCLRARDDAPCQTPATRSLSTERLEERYRPTGWFQILGGVFFSHASRKTRAKGRIQQCVQLLFRELRALAFMCLCYSKGAYKWSLWVPRFHESPVFTQCCVDAGLRRASFPLIRETWCHDSEFLSCFVSYFEVL